MLTQDARKLITESRKHQPTSRPGQPGLIDRDFSYAIDSSEEEFLSFRLYCESDSPWETTLREFIDTGHSYSDDYCAVCSMLSEDLEGPPTPHAHTESDIVGDDKKRKRTAQKRISNMFKVHGNADQEAPHELVLKKRISDRFDELGAMSHEQRQKEYADTAARRKKIGLHTDAFRSNRKTDTSALMPSKTAPNGHIPMGLSMPADKARHYTSPDLSSHKVRNSCPGSTQGCRASCLAKHGRYDGDAIRGHMDVLAQSMTHNASSTRDHATHIFHSLEKASTKAAKEGKQVLTRYSVTDDTGAMLHAEPTAKHFPNVVQMGYTKRHNTPHDPAKGIHTVFSDTGPVVSHDGKINDENFKRRNILHTATSQRGMPTYMVFNRRRPGAKHGADHPVTKEYHDTMKSLHTVRRYELPATEPKAGEAPEYHHPDGHGRVVSKVTGKSHRYQDHPTADPIKTVHGETIHASQHDARNVDSSSRVFKNPEGKAVGHVVPAFATTSTSAKNLKSSFFHHVEKIKDGVYHDAHPDDVAQAKKV